MDTLDEYTIADCVPNRKYKVPRAVLAERLFIVWTIVAKIRKLCLLKWNYDPDCKNVDQSPFHVSEAGSRDVGALALKGCPIVPLIEDHCATRERWSLNSITDSNEARLLKRLPGFEMVFKADGHTLEGKLQDYLFSKGLPCE